MSTYQDMAGMGNSELSSLPCKCVRCHHCHGSGRMRVECFGYPEDELESCDGCQGTGLYEVCDRCQLLDEFNEDEI